jgi:hypothetical protein
MHIMYLSEEGAVVPITGSLGQHAARLVPRAVAVLRILKHQGRLGV